MAGSLLELCHEAVFRELSKCYTSSSVLASEFLREARERLPFDLKESLFARYCDDVVVPLLLLSPAAASRRLSYTLASQARQQETGATVAQLALPQDGGSADPRRSRLESQPLSGARYRDVQRVNRATCQKVIPLCFAMWSSLDFSMETVRKLLYENVQVVNECDLNGLTPLHYAAIYHRVDACRVLLQHGADFERRNVAKKTALDLASDDRIRRMILARIALFTKEETAMLLEEVSKKNKSAWAIRKKDLKQAFVEESAHLERVISSRLDHAAQTVVPPPPPAASANAAT